MRILWVVLDGLGIPHVTEELMPRLHRLARDGWRAQGGGLGELPALTYPNHATFVTGVSPAIHGIVTNSVWRDGDWVPAGEVGPGSPTMFDRLAGRDTALVAGDQHLVGVCGGSAAVVHWPPEGRLPEGSAHGLTGYGADADVVAAARSMGIGGTELAFVQLDEVDAASHVYGPHSPEAHGQVRSTDAALGEILDLYRRVWQHTVVVVLSDHSHEEVQPGAGVDLGRTLSEAAPSVSNRAAVSCDGTAGYVGGGWSRRDLCHLDGVAGAVRLADGAHVVWGPPGAVVGLEWGQRGDHGSPRSRAQVAVVGGGHPAAATLGRRILDRPPLARHWAGWLLQLLDD